MQYCEIRRNKKKWKTSLRSKRSKIYEVEKKNILRESNQSFC